MSPLRDYLAWHEDYRDPDSALSRRLRQVQQVVEDFYDRTPGPVRVMSSCAGQGDDLLGVLARRPDLVERTSGSLLELHPGNAAVARQRIERLGARLEVREVDAGRSESYAGTVPADLVLLVGIMGNISEQDVARLVRSSPQFCAAGATVVWTRGDQQPDLCPSIRQWFGAAGFTEVAHHARLEGTAMTVGVHRLVGEPEPLVPGRQLFTFLR
ncbi:SAM-dependent methyltransferase [Luteococcus peritonei]|uniref:SAM-dependent methyltransferase n=1 Tax=Luteococcus peritonei TaxID=88874 RepID=A0ABW4RRV9_9ACTN